VCDKLIWPASHEKGPSDISHNVDYDQPLYDVENTGQLEIPDRSPISGKHAGIDQTGREVVLGAGAEADVTENGVDGADLPAVDPSAQMEESLAVVRDDRSIADSTAHVVPILGNAVAEVVGVVKDAGSPIEPIAAAVDTDAGVTAWGEGLDW